MDILPLESTIKLPEILTDFRCHVELKCKTCKQLMHVWSPYLSVYSAVPEGTIRWFHIHHSVCNLLGLASNPTLFSHTNFPVFPNPKLRWWLFQIFWYFHIPIPEQKWSNFDKMRIFLYKVNNHQLENMFALFFWLETSVPPCKAFSSKSSTYWPWKILLLVLVPQQWLLH